MADDVYSQLDFSGLDSFLTRDLCSVTVERLKAFIDKLNVLNRSNSLRLRKTGRKGELLDSISEVLRTLRVQNDLAGYRLARRHFDEINSMNNRSNPFGPAPLRGSPHTPSMAPTYQTTTYPSPNARNLTAGGTSYRPVTFGGAPTSFQMIAWKSSPAWRPLKAVSDIHAVAATTAIEDGRTHEKKQKTFLITLTPADVAMLTQIPQPDATSQKSLRLFCTSSDYYPGNAGNPIPLEFPFHSEISVNQQVVQFKKGLKGKSGTAAPVNLDGGANLLRKSSEVANHIYFAHQGPSLNKKTKVPKRFWLQVCMTETWSTAELTRRVLNGVKRSSESILSGIKAHVADEDISVGSSKLSLKCPLSYMRIENPVRSTLCTHLQCFEAESWLEMNEQTPQWQCPTCEKELPLDKIFIDGFFQSILDACPEDVEEVVVEADGEWHTEDAKYGSASWMANRPAKTLLASVKASPAPASSRKQSPTAELPDHKPVKNANGADLNEKKKEPEVFVLDDDDTDDEDVPLMRPNPMPADSNFNDRRPFSSNLTPGASSVPPQTPVATNAGVIDLTGFDSDDEDRVDEQPPPPSAGFLNGHTIHGGPPRVTTINGHGMTQNGGKRRRRDGGLMDGIFGSESEVSDRSDTRSDREDLLFSPNQRGRRVVYDDQDPVPKRARLSGADSDGPAQASGGLRGGGTDTLGGGVSPYSAGPLPHSSDPTPPPPPSSALPALSAFGRSTDHRDSSRSSADPNRISERSNTEFLRLPALQASDRDSLGSNSPGPRTPDIVSHPGVAPLPKWQPIGYATMPTHRPQQHSTSTNASGSSSYGSSYRTAPTDSLPKAPSQATPLGRHTEDRTGPTRFTLPRPETTTSLPKRY